MKTILLVAKQNDLTKGLSNFLSRYFSVQYAAESGRTAIATLDVTPPDLVIMLLVGAADFSEELFTALVSQYNNIPVLTIGTASEQNHFITFYGGWQFTHLMRPCEYEEIMDAVCRRLGVPIDEIMADSTRTVVPAPGAAPMEVIKTTVLVVDDNAQMLRSMKAMLEPRFEVMVAPSGIKAMTMIGKKKPDVILLDYEMPVVDGKQTLEMIRAEDDLQDIPVIFLTGVDDRAHIQAVLALRPAGYMLKPPVQQKVVDAIEKAVSR